MTDTLKGVFAAALTPLNSDLSVDHERLVSHCRWLLENGCDGLAVLGTTGEANSFNLSERIGILETLSDAGIPGSALMPGTGSCSIPETVEMTRRAVDLGAAGVLMLPPFYYKNVSDEGLFAAYSEVIERVSDARLKVYLYHFPQMSAVPLSYDLIERLLKRYPDTIAGMKDSSGVFDNMAGAAEKFPGFGVFSGGDDFLLPLLKKGGVGCITAVCNIACNLSAELYQAWRNDDPAAEDLQKKLITVREAAQTYPYSAGLKSLLAHYSGDQGWTTVRPPLVALDETQTADLVGLVAATGHTLPPLG
ncbi:MAG: dihydrodipicolinate synthase family protein [Rhodospirillaceae bacterium]|jgi:4-hydroxy-tetrahydrodipicolinate synthase|nr:dihydrodipicolinate synthase family protein [Rhodospirillaceae bacterium]MBT5243131.1 dihydrodipicolinate synthase family protein [Rhodospirillaceae bacterium]MBT5563356.1 dihydrodipicolinate synthase family protein [Rhodospirillaceae bacterium]MBT6243670.1 dihydrodipicolinate synthase family protein [Rhodospirillaceae bacterium]MBT7136398.1 dihydrodipicolinate synthase family protein [Rhodospirillaceae bacterium]